MKFSAALLVAAAAIASAAPSFEPKPEKECPADYPTYSECSEDIKVVCYPAGEPEKPYEECSKEEQDKFYPWGPPKGHHGPKGPKPEKECKPIEDCSEDEKKECYPAGPAPKPYEECEDEDKDKYYPHGPPMKPVTYTTEVVHEYTTYCPEETTVVYETKTYSGHKDEYITVECPEYGCTVEKPVYTTSVDAEYTHEPAMTTSYAAEETHYAPAEETTYAPAEETTYAPAETSTYAPAETAPVQVAGAAKVGGAGFAAVAGLVALVM